MIIFIDDDEGLRPDTLPTCGEIYGEHAVVRIFYATLFKMHVILLLVH